MDTNGIVIIMTILFIVIEILLSSVNKKHKLVIKILYIIEFFIFFKVFYDSFFIDLDELIMQFREKDSSYTYIIYLIVGAFALVSFVGTLVSRWFRSFYLASLINYLIKTYNILRKNYITINGRILEIGLQKERGKPIEIIVKDYESNGEKSLFVPANLIERLTITEEDVTIDYFENGNEVWSIEKQEVKSC